MKHKILWLLASVGMLSGCQPELPFTDGQPALPEAERSARAEQEEPSAAELPARSGGRAEIDLRTLARPARGEVTVCRAFARAIAEAALQHGGDVAGFMADLQDEFVGGTDNPFDMKQGLRDGNWNQRYFYAGHGGFRPEYDDAQRHPDGGNHQPGHFVSVLSVAQQFGEEQALIALAAAGDYNPGEEDDLRLSMVAIPLGTGLRDGSVTPAEVAQRARELCRS